MTNDDWDDLINEEDNPYDDPDLTFESEESSFNAGFYLALENESFDATDLDRDIVYPEMAFEEKKAFKAGYHDGAMKLFNLIYGDNKDEVDIRPPVYRPEDYDDDGEPINENEVRKEEDELDEKYSSEEDIDRYHYENLMEMYNRAPTVSCVTTAEDTEYNDAYFVDFSKVNAITLPIEKFAIKEED
ncbi:MAG: hypothetical protein FWD47_11485 [Treponema sp.]|nr:hypothetical protein [Treponema sp.]